MADLMSVRLAGDRATTALRMSESLCDEAHLLVEACEETVRRSRDVRHRVRRRRSAHGALAVPRRAAVHSFRIEGMVDDAPCSAHWDGRCLTADEALLQRAEIVVDLGETFTSGERVVTASLEHPDDIASVLTLLRACSRVTAMDIEWQLAPGGST